MSNELKPIQASQNPPAVIEAPVAIDFLGLPEDVLFQILGRIWQAKDVANLNLVSKAIQSLNQEAIVAEPRLEKIFLQNSRFHYPSNHSYRDYIREYSFPDDYNSVSAFAMIEAQFPKTMDGVGRWQLQPLSTEIWFYLLGQFSSLRTGSQLMALLAITSSFRATQKITKRFYDILPPPVQTELRWQIWNANGQSSVASDGIDRGLGFGEYIIDNEINSPLVQTAIRNYLSKFGVDTSINS